MPRQKINVTPRTFYSRFAHNRKVYDAEGWLNDVEYCVQGADSAKDARRLAREQIAFKQANPSLEANGFKLEALDVNTFALIFPHGGSCTFEASDMRAALADVAKTYAFRQDIAEFVCAVREYDFPTREEIQALKVGDFTIDCFGKVAEVTQITAQRDDINGRAFVCYYTRFGSNNGAMSMSRKQDTITRTVRVSNKHTSAEIDTLEASLRNEL